MCVQRIGEKMRRENGFLIKIHRRGSEGCGEMLYPNAAYLLAPWSVLRCPREKSEVTSGLHDFSSRY